MSDEDDLPAPAAPATTEPRPSRTAQPVEAKPSESGRGRQVTVTREIHHSSAFFGGPLPPPEILAKYNDSFEGCAQRIVVMAEEQALHRRSLERMALESGIKRQSIAQWLGFIAFMCLCGGSMFLFWMGRDATATALLASTLLGFGGLYIYGQRKQDQDLAEKRKPFEPEDPTKKIPAGNKD